MSLKQYRAFYSV